MSIVRSRARDAGVIASAFSISASISPPSINLSRVTRLAEAMHRQLASQVTRLI
jgi:hypothetical protein